jgi:chromosome segregation ATPase
MKQCSGLWIVAPITRAVNDKAAKKLLGDQFKRQLKYDGAYSSVTFICSKTDDISITEAEDGLGLDDKLGDDWAEIDSIKRTATQLAERLVDLKDQKAALNERIHEVEEEEELWEDLERRHDGGRAVYAPPQTSGRKRKRNAKPSGSRKNRLSIDTDSDSDDNDGSVFSDSDSASGSDKENDKSSRQDRVRLTAEQLDEKVSAIKAEKRSLRQHRKQVDADMADIRKEIKAIKAEREEIEAKIKSMCIKGRNTYSRTAIKADFASGIKE